ncbi:MAG: hypothetical protein IGS48_21025 [Oscillatoriales cyanobacterium C42_A2020_001]|nr:hypothetical protein [Leptolyngbyaceae cyanobacterium C42_A2020_001]
MFYPNIVRVEHGRCLRLRGRIGLAAVNPSVKALIAQFLRNASQTPDDSIRINSLAAGGAGQS